MKNEKIKKRVSTIYEKIKELSDELILIRKNCSHEKTNLSNYMWAPGHIDAQHICEHCGDLVIVNTEDQILI